MARKAGNMGKEESKEMEFWTQDEFQTFLECVADKEMSYYAFEILYWTGIREGELLDEAIEWCRSRGVEFYATNKDYPEETKEGNPVYSRKLKADMFIDDRNVGGLPDWGTIYRMISHRKTWSDLLIEAENGISIDNPYNKESRTRIKKKKWWQI